MSSPAPAGAPSPAHQRRFDVAIRGAGVLGEEAILASLAVALTGARKLLGEDGVRGVTRGVTSGVVGASIDGAVAIKV